MESNNPYTPPETKPEGLKPLGSLAQSARGKQINQARGILIFIGLLTMAINGFLLYNLPKEVTQAIQQNNVDPAQVESFRQQVTFFGYMLYGGPMVLGALFLLFAVIIKKFPVPITIASLALYLLAALIFAIINPMSLAQGFIMKIIIVVGLAKAVKAAIAYETETSEAALGELAE